MLHDIKHDPISKPMFKLGNRFVGNRFAVIRTYFHASVSQNLARTSWRVPLSTLPPHPLSTTGSKANDTGDESIGKIWLAVFAHIIAMKLINLLVNLLVTSPWRCLIWERYLHGISPVAIAWSGEVRYAWQRTPRRMPPLIAMSCHAKFSCRTYVKLRDPPCKPCKNSIAFL